MSGTEVVDSWYTGYGDMLGMNEHGEEYGVDQELIYEHGNQYLRDDFPDLDYILKCKLFIEGNEVSSLEQLGKYTKLSESALNVINNVQSQDEGAVDEDTKETSEL